MNNFRLLRADEIDCRVSQIKESELSLLLYKDARCDMNILDETVGPFRWQRHHSRDNANCTVSILDPETNEWVSKEDTGTESNTEAQKGLASDSFKRACFNWGIGRELYTAPFVWVSVNDCNIGEKNGRRYCKDSFSVESISYNENQEISVLTIVNDKTHKRVFSWKSGRKLKEGNHKETKTASLGDQIETLIKTAGDNEYAVCADCGKNFYAFTKRDGSVMSVRDMLALGLRDLGKPVCKDCYKAALKS